MKSKISRSPSYLVRNPYTYCFRICVPIDLQRYVGKKELRYSLRTGYLGVAKHKARIIAGQVQLIFKSLRKGNSSLMKLSDNQIQEIVQKYLKSYIDGIEERMYSGELLPFEIDPQSFYQYIDTLDEAKQDIIEGLGTRDYRTVERIVDDLFKENGIENIDKSSVSYQKLCRGILRAQLKGIDIEKKQMLGGYSGEIDTGSTNALQNIQKKKESPLLSEAIDRYLSEKKVNLTPRTVEEYYSGFKLFINVVGNIPIQSINREKITKYKDALLKLPSNMEKRKIYRDKTIDELLCMEIPEQDRRANRTIKKLIGRVGTFFTYTIYEGLYKGNNPALHLILPKSKDDEDMKRAPYDKDDLVKLFHSNEYLNDKHAYPYMFWSPIIALFHGIRQNEIAQLHLSDIKKSEDGVWVFEVIENREDKSVKTIAGKRLVPMHPFVLKELNFLGLYRNLKSKGVDRLFHELKKSKKGYGARVSKWFNERYKKRCGIAPAEDGRLKDFHSFRTTFITDLRHKKVHDMMLKQVVGHKIDSTVTGEYTDKFPLQDVRKEIIEMIDFEKQIDLSHLKNSNYVIKDKPNL